MYIAAGKNCEFSYFVDSVQLHCHFAHILKDFLNGAILEIEYNDCSISTLSLKCKGSIMDLKVVDVK